MLGVYWLDTLVEVFRLEATRNATSLEMEYVWSKVSTVFDSTLNAGELKCFIDLFFQRPGKDAPMPITAGRAPDRTGLLFCNYTTGIKANDRVKVISGPFFGVFEIRTVPDTAAGFLGAEHLEIPIVEVQQGSTYPYPGAEVTP